MTSVALEQAIPASMTMVRKTVTLDAKAVEAATELAGGNLYWDGSSQAASSSSR